MLRNLFAKDRPRTIVPGSSRCDRFQPRLLSYVDHELSADERRLMEMHLQQCAACRAEMASFQQAEALLGSAASNIPSPGDLRPEFYARLEQSRRRSPAIKWGFAVPAIACAAMALFLFRQVPGDKKQSDGARRSGGSGTVAQIKREPSTGVTVGVPDIEDRKSAESSKIALNSNFERQRPPRNRNSANRITAAIPGHALRRPGKTASIALRTATAGRLVTRNIVMPPTKHGTGLALFRYAARPAATTDSLSLNSMYARKAFKSIPESEAAEARETRLGGKLVLAGLVSETELHVSDESRDFMASTRIGSELTQSDKRAAIQLDDDYDFAQESVELPALP